MSEEERTEIVKRDDWDGRPMYALTTPQLLSLYATVAQWHGHATGPPIPFGGGQRAAVDVTAIFCKTREDAERAMWVHVRDSCQSQGMVFIEEDWTIRLVLLGGS